MTSRRPRVMSTRTRFGGFMDRHRSEERTTVHLGSRGCTPSRPPSQLPQGVCGGDEQTLQQTYFRRSASCVQSFDDSLDIACRMTYRISLRSSSLWEPRHPLLKVLISLIFLQVRVLTRRACCRIFVIRFNFLNHFWLTKG